MSTKQNRDSGEKTCAIKPQKIALALGMLLLASQAQADQLADIKAAGVVKVATFDANPPFSSVDAKTHHIVGYDVDFAQALAKSARRQTPSWWRRTRPTVFRCCSPAKPT